jgi:hypothetical protein
MARKPVTVNFEITNQSFQKLDRIMKKFNLNWNAKVFKSTDDLNKNLTKLSDRIYQMNLRMANARLSQAQKGGTTGGAGFDADKFFEDLDKAMKGFSESMKDAAEEIKKIKITVKGSTDSMNQEQADRWESINNAEVVEGRRKVFMQSEQHRMRKIEGALDHRLKQERLLTRHLMSMFGGGAVGGGLGLIMKEVTGGIGKKFTKASATQDYLKTEEGQNVLQFQKAAQGAKNPLGQFGANISSEWADKGVTKEGIDKAGGIMGRAKSWMGRRVEGAQTGDMTKMMGGKKGMLLGAGALAGVGIMKKAISLGIESSPMMQQMLKLWKFGIMMIFRPIGDFFGFFLRPIFVMLLRKFIIPFYQEYLPLMQQMGHDLGTKIANLLTWILESPLLGGAAGQERFVEVSATAGKGVDYAKFSEPLSLAMTESLIQNAGYWEKMFVEMGKVPEWVKTSLPNNPQLWAKWERVIDDVADSSNTNVTGMFGTTPLKQASNAWDDFWNGILEDLGLGNKSEGVTKGYNKTSGYTNVDLNTIPDYLGGTKNTSSNSLDTSSSPATNNFYMEMNSNITVNNPDDSTTEETIEKTVKTGNEEVKKWTRKQLANIPK